MIIVLACKRGPGVGRVLALTIMMEMGPIDRFAQVGNYVSCGRKVPAARFSNDKKKGTNIGKTLPYKSFFREAVFSGH
jgi:hypothetical protein